MECVARSQYHRHNAEQPKLSISLTAPDHPKPDGYDQRQINHIKQGFHDCLHTLHSFLLHLIGGGGCGQNRPAVVAAKQHSGQ